MVMNMCIIMNMNIYISPENEKNLREYASTHPNYSMSGLINLLLANHFTAYGTGVPSKTPPSPKIPAFKTFDEPPVYMNHGGTTPSGDVTGLFKPDVAAEVANDPELPCCKNENQPCKHWVWDISTGEGYKNSLSGRLLEVE